MIENDENECGAGLKIAVLIQKGGGEGEGAALSPNIYNIPGTGTFIYEVPNI